MNLLIHDLSAAEWARVADNYQDWTVVADTGGIRPCRGCFYCWSSGTGVCAVKDGYENMGQLIHEADEVVVMSRYTYGGFSSFVKNVFDRSLGYVLPEFETAFGEMHHQKRYAEDKPVTFVFRGTGLTEEDKEKARRYVAAVCRNLRGVVKDVLFEDCAPEDGGVPGGEAESPSADKAALEDTAAFAAPEREMAAPAAPATGDAAATTTPERAGILLIDCSIRGRNSNTRVFLKQLQAYMASPADLLGLYGGGSPAEIVTAVANAETVVLGVPLYVDGLPASTLRLLEMVKACGAGQQCKVYAVVNNGLYESRQNENLLSAIKDWCAESGSKYCGSLAIGAGEVAGVLMRGKKWTLWPVRNVKKGLRHLAKTIDARKETIDAYADPFVFPRWLYIWIANTSWRMQKKAAKARK